MGGKIYKYALFKGLNRIKTEPGDYSTGSALHFNIIPSNYII